ncbi:putative disease resistance RPP13-like protein 3 isoform X2 [Camellia sinensis]|uniref:putative disease resistance RPP13-like protein 3 isoform X2 n=1 Tax=Camellia sinensis TaxID=4442 RepID=UPI0010361011|nr:putative disease resistance RPP13-like protein 3 isoform X2 [Camellia sinensis]
MVDAVVSSVVRRLGGLLIDQVIFLQGVRDEVNYLRTKLEYMLCFLKDAEEKQDQDRRIHKWVSDIRDAAYEAEDIIDKFILKVEEGGIPKRTGFKASLRKYFRIYKQANKYGIGKEIQEWKNRLDEIDRNHEIFKIRNIEAAGEGSSGMNERFKQLRRTTPYEDDQHVVGFTKDVELLMSELLEETPDQRVISIVGMGGLGKTTMARKLHNSSSVGDKFECKGWVSVSKDYNIQNLLRRTIKSFKMPTTKDELEMLEKMETEDLECHLHEFLKESRYLVVIDDVWDTDAWASLRRALPDNKKGSRVIITTRIKLVAESSGRRKYVHELPFLQPEESWELFCEIVFPDYDGVDDKTNRCPPSLEELARDMVKKCRGLPLAIVVLGGLLSRKHADEWPKLQGRFWRHVTDRLIRLWVAEGFIQQAEGKTLEETAADYLNELIDRNLIQVAQRNWMRIKRCRVHDLLRDFAIEKSKELKFLHVYDGNVYSAPSPCRHRRLASHSCGLKRFASFDQSSNLHLRTLLFFNSENESAELGELQFLCKKLRLLRVLDLEEIIFNHSQEETEHVSLLDAIEKLIHLRYLRISESNINKIPPSIGNLQALQTLEFSKPCSPIMLPDEICNAKQLRHLIGCFKWPFRVENLTNLQTLNYIAVDDRMEFSPSWDLINLRELCVVFNGESKGFTLDSIGRLRNLRTLYLDASTDTVWNPTLQPLSQCQHLLQLKLHGKIGNLPTEMHKFLPNLKYLSLDGSEMEEDPMPSLEKLPKLTILDLCFHDRPNKFVCTAGGFPQLEILFLNTCHVKELQVDEGGMPLLRGLGLYHSDKVSIPERLRSIPVPKNWDVAEADDWPY